MTCVQAAGAAGFLGVSLPGRARGRRPAAELAGGGRATRPRTTTRRSSTPPRCSWRRRSRRSGPTRSASRGRARRVRGHGQRVHRVHRGGRRERPVEHRDDARRARTTAASCSTARRCSSPARTRPTGAAPSPAPIRRRPARHGLIHVPGRHDDARASRSTRHATANRWTLSTHPLRRRPRRRRRGAGRGRRGLATAQRRAARRAQSARRGWAGRRAPSRRCSTTAPAPRDRVLARRARRPRDALVRGGRTGRAGARAAGRRRRHRSSRARMSKVCVTELLQRIARVGAARSGPTRSPHRAGSADRSPSGSPTRRWSGSTRR